MKKSVNPFFIITILLLGIFTPGISQEDDTPQVRNIYKFGLGKLLAGQFFLGYERVVSDHFSISAQVGFVRKAFYLESLSKLNLNAIPYGIRTEKTPYGQYIPKRTPTDFGSQINLEFRFYPKKLGNKFFLGARVGYRYVNFGNNLKINYRNSFGDLAASKNLDAKQNVYCYGMTIGCNMILGEKTALEIYLLVGGTHIELNNPKPIQVIPNPVGPTYDRFLNNHLNPVKKLHLELGVFIGLFN